MPIEHTVVKEDSAKVSNDVDDEEDSALLGSHGQVATILVASHRMSLARFHQGFPDLCRAAEDGVGRVDGESEDEENHEQDDGMNVVGKECRLDATEDSVEHHAHWQKETSCSCRDAGQGRDYSAATGQQHGRDQKVGGERESHEDAMSNGAISRTNNLQVSVRVWSSAFQLNGDCSEQYDLHSRARGIPERPAYAVLVGTNYKSISIVFEEINA